MRIAVIDEHTMTTSKTTVKAKWNDDLRRFTQPTADLTYAYLLARISELFVIPVSQIKLTYVDSDLDAISICCEKDVLEVIKASKGESPLRLNVSSVPIDGEPNESEDDEAWTLMGTGTPPTNEESPVGRQSPVLQTPSFHEMHADSFPAELDNTPPQSDGPGPAVAESNEGSESLPALLDSREIPRRPRQCIDSDADSPVVQRQARSVSNIYPDLDGTSSVATKQVTTSIYEDAVCTGSSLTPSPTHSSGLYPDANEPYTAEASSSSASSTPPGASGTGTGAGDTPVDLCSSGSECARGTKDAGLGLVTQTKISAEPEAVETAAAAAATTGTGWDWADPFRTVASTVSRDASAPKPSSSRTDNAPFPESTEPISPQPHDSPVAATQLPSPLVLRCEDFEGQAQSQLEDEGTSQLSPALGSTGDSYTHVLSDSERSPSPSTSFTSIAPRLPSNPAASSSRTPTSPPVATVAQNIGLYPPVDNHAVTGCTNTDTSKVEENAGASVYPDYSFSGVAADTDLDAVASEAHAAADSVVLAPGAVENESEGESHADVAGAVPAAVGADTNNIPQVTWMEHVVNEGHFHRLILQTRLEHEYNQKLRPTVWIIARAVADKMRAAGTYTEAQLQVDIRTCR
ncbi:hypothetical protein, variant [Sphaeroforma arctica JP610]|uniref:PB1 domain-containing protein n=1 Tax=Sphaeroforma arctica JP610 TaxID=667725 RepID=A0A0L0FKB3_9EUKA|nr:hypothetical protein, variant [Sphaeroforma arctica JP610]KNC76916.1 hypothetical protein, variant [Sphaeroforma arctica JP610]|eukprot:XP_014150818.1 hypothetical protein, variant [Sphaeroforma arctica JP610]